MDVFISWSGERGRKVADTLANWLSTVLDDFQTWTATTAVSKGARWTDEISSRIGESACAIICATPANFQSPWVAYEAGVLARALGSGSVFVYLNGIGESQLKGPLGAFESFAATEDGTRRLVTVLNRKAGLHLLPEPELAARLKKWWPVLKSKLEAVLDEMPSSERRMDREHAFAASTQRTCYVAISDAWDDDIFSAAIVPALKGSGLIPVRRDQQAPLAVSARALIELADLVIGDVSPPRVGSCTNLELLMHLANRSS